MRIEVEVKTVRDLVDVSRVNLSDIAAVLDLSVTMTGLKIRGIRATFLDEIPKFVKAFNATKNVHIDDADLINLFGGRSALKVRGYAAHSN